MESASNRIEELFNKYLSGTINAEEYKEFWQELNNTNFQTLSPQLQNLWAQTKGVIPVISDEEWNGKLKALIQKAEEEDAQKKKVRGIPVWTKWVAAAAILIAVATTAIVISNQWGRKVPGSIGEKPPSSQDVAPPSNTRAVITLANGTKVYLDSAGNGVLAQENNVAVVRNADGSIEYNRKDAKTQSTQSDIVYNTIFNPRGSKVISLTLSDGTKVWLNSESSLRYPASFAPAAVSREVEITGEAYFEVKHNSKQPFKVHLPNGSIVEDLGTGFNINAYNDEASIKTTLIEGSVQITAANAATAAVKLKPGEQAVINNPANPSIRSIRVQTNVDLEKITSWKANEFNFSDDNMQTIMRQLARWYNIQPIITAPTETTYTGRITRNVPLSEVLKMFERVGYVKFEINDRVVKVIPIH